MKKRHIKTFAEKYGIRSVYSECWEIMSECRRIKTPYTDEELFAKIPYLGYLYVPVSQKNGRFWYDTNLDRIRAKVIEVDHYGHVKLAHIDDHNGGIAFPETTTLESDTHRVKGNVLIHIDEIEKEI